jgi:hypothetical protein
MSWTEQLQDLGVWALLTVVVYLSAGPIFRSLHPTGMLNWQGRRWRKAITILLVLFFGGCEVLLLFQDHMIGAAVAVALFIGLSVLFLLLVRWWWQDARKEKAAQEALVEKLHQEGRELVAPPMSTGKRVWRWVVNGYAIALVLALIYGLIRYLVRKY